MKVLGFVLLAFVLVVGIGDIANGIYGNYQYTRDFESYWQLADKASTIPQKSEYIDKFVSAIESGGFAGKYNALFMNTPDNSFDKNLEALKSLQGRLHEIEKMDITSFQYQTAIQQITAQEQGEAKNMLDVFSGIWWKEHHFWLWDWIAFCQITGIILLGIFTVMILITSCDY